MARIMRKGIEDIPPELLEEIFSRIPVHYLIQTKYVCQPWRNLINHPLFPIPNHPTLIFVISRFTMYFVPDLETCDKAITINLSHIWNNKIDSWRMLGSLNGLLCLEKKMVNCLLQHTIWNPFRGDPVELPHCLPRHYIDEEEYACLTGFGYSPNTREYKVIRIIHSYRKYVDVRILTVGDTSWRNIPLPTHKQEEHLWHYSRHGIFLNGYLHWLTYIGHNLLVHIKAFNVEDETFGIVPLPPSLLTGDTDIVFFKLGLLNNCLIILDSHKRDVDIWMMKDYGVDKSWVHQFSIPGLGYGQNETCRGVEPLAFQKNGNLLFYKLGHYEKEASLSSYDPKTKTINEFQLTGLPLRFGVDFSSATSHVGTLRTLPNVVQMKTM